MFLVDAHVHFHRGFSVEGFFDSALKNIDGIVKQLGLGDATVGMLLFTEASGDRCFEGFRNLARGTCAAEWGFHRTEEKLSLIACKGGVERLILVSGRQIRTDSGLEVLAIGTEDQFREKMSLERTLAAVLERGAIPVVPWGFGKWLGGRKASVVKVLKTTGGGKIFLGDNGGRPLLISRPDLFKMAASSGVLDLPGTDPLPFKSHERRAGSYGFVLEGELDRGRPGECLKELLARLEIQPRVFGRLQKFPAFARDQLAMQVRKLLRAS